MVKFKGLSTNKFNRNYFQLQKYQIEIIFQAFKLLGIKNVAKAHPDGALQNAWNNNKTRAMLLISTLVEFEQLQMFMSSETCTLNVD